MLKNCPFCDGTAEINRQYGRYGCFVFVKCSFCGAQTKAKSAEDIDDDDAFWKQTAVKNVVRLWNMCCDQG